jgi:acetyl esterase/lipase
VAGPAILLIHGGGWLGGDKVALSQRCHLLAGYGYLVVNINYRLANGTPNHSWPAALEDARRALTWIQANADSLGVDRKRIGVIGESVGGELALLLGQTGGVRCVVSESAPTDLLTAPSFTSVISPLVFTSKPIEDDYRTASPIIGIGKASAPTMIVHGRSDDLVPFSQGQELQGALRRNKVPVVMLAYEGGHIMLNTQPEERARVISAEMIYLKTYLSPDDGFGNLR